MTHSRRGATLVELIVSLVVLAAITSVATLAARRIDRPLAADPQQSVADSLRVAVAEARTITLALSIHGVRATATVHPDGRAVADTVLHIDPLTGRRTDVR
jgi:Tfp pilus assembly protein FimT